MKRERDRESDGNANGQRNNTGSSAFFIGYGVFSPGCSFARPPGLQNKPNAKRPRVSDRNTTTGEAPLKLEPEPERFRELSIKGEPGEDLHGLEPGVGPLRRNNLSDTETPTQGNSNSPGVQTQAPVHHSVENDRLVVTENGHLEDGKPLNMYYALLPSANLKSETPILTTIKEKLHNAILGLTSNEPTLPPENLPP